MGLEHLGFGGDSVYWQVMPSLCKPAESGPTCQLCQDTITFELGLGMCVRDQPLQPITAAFSMSCLCLLCVCPCCGFRAAWVCMLGLATCPSRLPHHHHHHLHLLSLHLLLPRAWGLRGRLAAAWWRCTVHRLLWQQTALWRCRAWACSPIRPWR